MLMCLNIVINHIIIMMVLNHSLLSASANRFVTTILIFISAIVLEISSLGMFLLTHVSVLKIDNCHIIDTFY